MQLCLAPLIHLFNGTKIHLISYKGHKVNALVLGGDEGRGYLR